MITQNDYVIKGKFELSNFLVLVMAVTAGMTVANIYYIQPLLGEIARTFMLHR